MIQNTSATGKNTTKKSAISNKDKNKSTISFKLHIPGYHQESVSYSGRSYTVVLSRTSKGCHCPSCGLFSKSLHSHYFRQLQSLEILNHPLTLSVKARKFRCKNPDCRRQVFCESLSSLASPYARHTLEVEDRIRHTSLKTTSRICSELLHKQNIFYSPSSCLRSAHKTSFQENAPSKPVAIGIDDFAQKKGHIYGTVVVDLIRWCPIEIIPEREGRNLERYLRENPQIQYISRDRGRSFVDAINRILPGATQICDRFHLIKNIVDSLTEEIAVLTRLSVGKQPHSYPGEEECRNRIMETLFNLGDQRHRRKLKLYIAADNYMRKGMSISQVASQLGEHPQTIRRLVYRHTKKDYMSSRQRIILKYADELALEISRGCISLKDLKKKMQGKMSALDVASATIGIREDIKEQRKQIREYNKSVANRKNKRRASVVSIRHFILKGETTVKSLNELLKNQTIKTLIRLAGDFREMINGNPKQLSLEKWIKEALGCQSKAMRRFAIGIKADQQAVQNTMDIYLNNGILEGTVNKIKAIKRQMFNRASYSLLKVKLIAFKT